MLSLICRSGLTVFLAQFGVLFPTFFAQIRDAIKSPTRPGVWRLLDHRKECSPVVSSPVTIERIAVERPQYAVGLHDVPGSEGLRILLSMFKQMPKVIVFGTRISFGDMLVISGREEPSSQAIAPTISDCEVRLIPIERGVPDGCVVVGLRNENGTGFLEVKTPGKEELVLPGSPLPGTYVIVDEVRVKSEIGRDNVKPPDARCVETWCDVGVRWLVRPVSDEDIVLAGSPLPKNFVVLSRISKSDSKSLIYWAIRRVLFSDKEFTILAGTNIPDGFVLAKAIQSSENRLIISHWQIIRGASQRGTGKEGIRSQGIVNLQGNLVLGKSVGVREPFSPDFLAGAESVSDKLAAAATEHDVYAPPMVFGPWVTVASHGGAVRVHIRVEPLGDTVVTGQVRYFRAIDKKQVTVDFSREIEVTTANVWANVEIRLRGVPTGSACKVYVSASGA